MNEGLGCRSYSKDCCLVTLSNTDDSTLIVHQEEVHGPKLWKPVTKCNVL